MSTPPLASPHLPPPSPPTSSPSISSGSLRVSLHELVLNRTDNVIEDDFKTWAQVYFIGGDGLPSGLGLWPLSGEDAKLGRTSVRETHLPLRKHQPSKRLFKKKYLSSLLSPHPTSPTSLTHTHLIIITIIIITGH